MVMTIVKNCQDLNNGVRFVSYIINPLLDSVSDTLIKFIKFTNNNDELFELFEKKEICRDILSEINLKTLHKQILNYVAPYFQLEIQ